MTTKRAFSLLEVLVSIAVVAVLMSLLLPALVRARDAGYRTVCGHNLRQLFVGWDSFLAANKESFPKADTQPEWYYGGVDFPVGSDVPVLAADRPIHRFITQNSDRDVSQLTDIFRCPADRGVFRRGETIRGETPASVLPAGSCYKQYGNSYRANGMLMNSTLAGIDRRGRALQASEIKSDLSRLLITGDSAWYYATRETGDAEHGLEAGWHRAKDSGNALAADGSVRFIDFASSEGASMTVTPRP